MYSQKLIDEAKKAIAEEVSGFLADNDIPEYLYFLPFETPAIQHYAVQSIYQDYFMLSRLDAADIMNEEARVQVLEYNNHIVTAEQKHGMIAYEASFYGIGDDLYLGVFLVGEDGSKEEEHVFLRKKRSSR